jgi:hypothetical protein
MIFSCLFHQCNIDNQMSQVLLLMASALRIDTPESIIGSKNELRARHMRVAEITEMMHVHMIIHLTFLNSQR